MSQSQPPPDSPDRAEEDRIHRWRLEQLAAVRSLRASPDFLAVVVPRLAKAEENALACLCDSTLSSDDLRKAQARYIAIRDINRMLLMDDLENFLENAVKQYQEAKAKPPENREVVDETFDNPMTGWFSGYQPPKSAE